SAGPRTFVKRNPPNPAPGHAAKQRDAEHRSMTGDADIRHQPVGAGAEVFDDRDQGDIEPAELQIDRQPARVIENDFRLRRELLQFVNERLGVQIIDRADAEWFDHRMILARGLMERFYRYPRAVVRKPPG